MGDVSYSGWVYAWWCAGSTLLVFLPSFFLFDSYLKRLAKRYFKANEAACPPVSTRQRSNSLQNSEQWILDNCEDSKARAMVVHKVVNLIYHAVSVIMVPLLQLYGHDWWVLFLAFEFASDLTDVIYQSLVVNEGMKHDLLLHHIIVLSGGPIGVYYKMDGRVILYCSSFCTMAMHVGWVLTKTPSIYRSGVYGYYLIFQTIIFAVCRGIITPYYIYYLYFTPQRWIADFPFFTYLSALSFMFCILNWVWLWRITKLCLSWFKQQKTNKQLKAS